MERVRQFMRPDVKTRNMGVDPSGLDHSDYCAGGLLNLSGVQAGKYTECAECPFTEYCLDGASEYQRVPLER